MIGVAIAVSVKEYDVTGKRHMILRTDVQFLFLQKSDPYRAGCMLRYVRNLSIFYAEGYEHGAPFRIRGSVPVAVAGVSGYCFAIIFHNVIAGALPISQLGSGNGQKVIPVKTCDGHIPECLFPLGGFFNIRVRIGVALQNMTVSLLAAGQFPIAVTQLRMFMGLRLRQVTGQRFILFISVAFALVLMFLFVVDFTDQYGFFCCLITDQGYILFSLRFGADQDRVFFLLLQIADQNLLIIGFIHRADQFLLFIGFRFGAGKFCPVFRFCLTAEQICLIFIVALFTVGMAGNKCVTGFRVAVTGSYFITGLRMGMAGLNLVTAFLVGVAGKNFVAYFRMDMAITYFVARIFMDMHRLGLITVIRVDVYFSLCQIADQLPVPGIAIQIVGMGFHTAEGILLLGNCRLRQNIDRTQYYRTTQCHHDTVSDPP